MKAILTRYHGPTDYRGSRISAFDCDGNRITIGYDYALSGEALYRKAAIALVHKMGWAPTTLAGGGTRDGYAFVMLDGAEPYAITREDQ